MHSSFFDSVIWNSHFIVLYMDSPNYSKGLGPDEMMSFKEAFDKYHPILYTLALNMLHDPEDAKDIVQNIFLTFWKNKGILESVARENILNYLYTMTKNSVLSLIKRKKIEQKVYSERKRDAAEDFIHERIFKYEKYRHIEESIMTLTPIKQEIVRLKRDGVSNVEIARKLNLSVNTVKSHYAVALKKMRDALRYLTMAILFIDIM